MVASRSSRWSGPNKPDQAMPEDVGEGGRLSQPARHRGCLVDQRLAPQLGSRLELQPRRQPCHEPRAERTGLGRQGGHGFVEQGVHLDVQHPQLSAHVGETQHACRQRPSHPGGGPRHRGAKRGLGARRIAGAMQRLARSDHRTQRGRLVAGERDRAQGVLEVSHRFLEAEDAGARAHRPRRRSGRPWSDPPVCAASKK